MDFVTTARFTAETQNPNHESEMEKQVKNLREMKQEGKGKVYFS